MPSDFRTKVKESVKGGSTRLVALNAAKDAMSGPLNERTQKKFDRGVKKLTPSTTPKPKPHAAAKLARQNKKHPIIVDDEPGL